MYMFSHIKGERFLKQLRTIFGPSRREMARDWRKMLKEKSTNFYPSSKDLLQG
jgi:hypothetical protein